MPHVFGYTGKPNTCHWCGRKIPEYTSDVGRFRPSRDPLPAPPAVGSEFEGYTVGRVVPMLVESVPTGRDHPYKNGPEMRERTRFARDGETPTWYRIHFDPPRFQGHYSYPNAGEAAVPAFDTATCATHFACRMVGVGKILRSEP